MILEITEPAAAKIGELLQKHDDADLGLRISVVGGGCSGFQYDMAFDKARETDEVIEVGEGVRVLVDPVSYRYLQGTQVDYVESLQGAGFAFNNPNATRTCGCGKSFAA
ncbi:MAG: iron-sulfur cluster insertion protein ErpA [Candidatus Dadabacteria bacterium]|nr:MAG: iron-sulfur cluster insertion protein ErpA [Candidatus Dadabacteria bacterium]